MRKTSFKLIAVTRNDLGYKISFPARCAVHRASRHTAVLWKTAPNAPCFGVRCDLHELNEGDAGVESAGIRAPCVLMSFFTIRRYWDWLWSTHLTDIGMIKLAGRRALKLTTNEKTHYIINYYTVDGTRGYSIRCVGPKKYFNKYAKEIDAIAASFKIIEAK